MIAVFIVTFLALCLSVLFAWSFRHLPRERWQILAALPHYQESDGAWRGINLTFYGVFNALGVAAAVTVTIFLAGTLGLPLSHLALGIVALLSACIPASKIINRIVEGHWHGFTIGGASFTGIVIGPWLVWGIAHLSLQSGNAEQEALMMMGSIAPAYALGEGIGRLACISFGCCYGRPLAQCQGWLQKWFSNWAFVFEGRLKKASYEHGFGGQRLIPVQGLTAIISSLAGLVGIALFLNGRTLLAYAFPIIVTQIWRFISEFLRADYRGSGRISAYQWMALIGTVYTTILTLLYPEPFQPSPDAARGLAGLWSPGAILLIEIPAIFVFIRMGVSTITSSRIISELKRDKTAFPPEDLHQNS